MLIQLLSHKVELKIRTKNIYVKRTTSVIITHAYTEESLFIGTEY